MVAEWPSFRNLHRKISQPAIQLKQEAVPMHSFSPHEFHKVHILSVEFFTNFHQGLVFMERCVAVTAPGA